MATTRLTALALPGAGLDVGEPGNPPAQASLVWPASLPVRPLVEGYQEASPDSTIRSELTGGIAGHRQRTRSAVRPFRVTWRLTSAQLATFETFYESTLGDGVLVWSWTHPRTGATMRCRFAGDPASQPVGHDTWDVTAELDGMP